MLNSFVDLVAIQNILIDDQKILSLLELTNATPLVKAKRIIRKNSWDDLVDSEKRICIYFVPSRPTECEDLWQQIVEIDCHTPSSEENIANEIISRIAEIIKNKEINGRYLKPIGVTGEISTAKDFYCTGIRLNYFNFI